LSEEHSKEEKMAKVNREEVKAILAELLAEQAKQEQVKEKPNKPVEVLKRREKAVLIEVQKQQEREMRGDLEGRMQELLKRLPSVFNADDVAMFEHINKGAASALLYRLNKQGYIRRVSRGQYRLNENGK
jgi:predicted transcriptional regulator of viral defense system